jgi:hypothetical protein
MRRVVLTASDGAHEDCRRMWRGHHKHLVQTRHARALGQALFVV